jgi:hypothetical protein
MPTALTEDAYSLYEGHTQVLFIQHYTTFRYRMGFKWIYGFFWFFFFSQQYYAFLNLNNATIKWLYIDPQRSVAVALQ